MFYQNKTPKYKFVLVSFDKLINQFYDINDMARSKIAIIFLLMKLCINQVFCNFFFKKEYTSQ